MSGLLLLLGIGLAIAWAGAVIAVAWMLTHPPRRTYAAAVARGRPGSPAELPGERAWRAWTFTSRGLTLPVWEIEGDDARGPTVILTHGWADSRIGGLMRVVALSTVASRLILWDLPGHGEAPGTCRLGTAEVEDLGTLLNMLGGGNGGGTSNARTVLCGWSLGAGASIVCAARAPGIAAVIAESPYRLPQTPARNVLRARALPWRLNLMPAIWLLGSLLGVGPRFRGFDRAAAATKLRGRIPLLVLHGEFDEVCPPEDGAAIAAAAGGRIEVIARGRHNDLWTDPALAAECTRLVQGFLREVGAAPVVRTASPPE